MTDYTVEVYNHHTEETVTVELNGRQLATVERALGLALDKAATYFIVQGVEADDLQPLSITIDGETVA